MPGSHDVNPIYAALWELVSLEFMTKFFAAYSVFLYLALIIWVASDISRRTASSLYRIICLLLVILFPFIGILIYIIIRPRKVTRSAFMKEIEANLGILSEIVDDRITEHYEISCPSCNALVKEEYLLCPACKTQLKHECHSCKKEIRKTWEICPFCEKKQEAPLPEEKPNNKNTNKKKKKSKKHNKKSQD